MERENTSGCRLVCQQDCRIARLNTGAVLCKKSSCFTCFTCNENLPIDQAMTPLSVFYHVR